MKREGNSKHPNNEVSKIKTEILLGRKQTVLDTLCIKQDLQDKTVFVTGGAGSIGSEICHQVLMLGCKKLIIFDIDENGLFNLDQTLKKIYSSDQYEIMLGSIRDSRRIADIFKSHCIDIVFHAAAHKHVPLMESNPKEAIKNNVFGTYNIANNTIKYGIHKFILISTDKAVNCTSVMGRTKRIAEKMIQWLNSQTDQTELAIVRFGNVLGSEGSVIPTFKNQIDEGGPVTVTHPDVERYFMSITEAVQLVLAAGFMAKGGEIFVLDMGKPIKILNLAKDMIRLAGLNPEEDIEIKFIGLRPGEKMYEELSHESELLHKTCNDKILICESSAADMDFSIVLNTLRTILESDQDFQVKEQLKALIEKFNL